MSAETRCLECGEAVPSGERCCGVRRLSRQAARPTRRKAARWRKAKGHYWGRWELWRGEAWLARIMEVRLRAGGAKYVWQLVGREPNGQCDALPDAKKAARTAIEHAEIEDALRELAAECEASS